MTVQITFKNSSWMSRAFGKWNVATDIIENVFLITKQNKKIACGNIPKGIFDDWADALSPGRYYNSQIRQKWGK